MQQPTQQTTQKMQDVMVQSVAVVAAILSAFGFGMGPSIGVGALAGGVLAVANIWALLGVVRSMLQQSASGTAQAGAAGLVFGKMMVVLVATAALLFVFRIDPVGLAIGFGSSILGLIVGASRLHFQAAVSTTSAERSN